MSTVIAGYDGSTASAAALEEAAKQASLQELPLRIVTAWSLPAVTSPYPIELNSQEYENSAKRLLEAAIDQVRAGHPDIEVTGGVVLDDPRSALLHATRPDDLLVVGTRGRGGIAGLLLGSVASHCIRHAPCPVLVVRNPSD